MTVAHEIRSPFKRKDKWFPDGYAEPLITIWHNDPETDGSDDSCGWFTPPVDRETVERVKTLGEKEFDFLVGKHGWKMTPLELVFNVWNIVKWREFKEHGLSNKEITQILSLSSNPADNIRYMVGEMDKERLGDLFLIIYKCILRMKRPWYQHPRWHVWHWSFQIHHLLTFKRWAFSRCCWCGGRFSWGYSPIGYSWHGSGPGWFRNAEKVAHQECDSERRSNSHPVKE